MLCAARAVAAVRAVASPRGPGDPGPSGDAAKEAQNWFTYSGNYNSNRDSLLAQMTRQRQGPEAQAGLPSAGRGHSQSTRLVVDGVMYSRRGRTTSSR